MPHPSDPPKRGEIYWVDHNPARGSEQAGMRPGVIISRDSLQQSDACCRGCRHDQSSQAVAYEGGGDTP
ncbi:type II toxin-antitoxin system PemK/MazF family toxin [Streptosporangium sp. OZ121]|uniref:type II toxin-antitoxin system PemK/MazF family toxin n=1 Tax=Streptosporangium sp. OZ121 TaxID=3444183 RepID=UPI003F79CFA9